MGKLLIATALAALVSSCVSGAPPPPASPAEVCELGASLIEGCRGTVPEAYYTNCDEDHTRARGLVELFCPDAKADCDESDWSCVYGDGFESLPAAYNPCDDWKDICCMCIDGGGDLEA